MEITNAASWNAPVNGTAKADAVTGRTGRKPDDRETAAARKVAKEFETLFVGMMLKSMRETVGKDKLTNGGHGEEVYRSMLDQEYAKSLTEHGGVGLTAMLERQLAKPVAAPDRNQGMNSHDTTNQGTKTEVTYENR